MIWTIVLISFLFLLPFIVKTYYLSVVNLMCLNILVALGLNVLVGNTGQISLGHAGFVAIGAYSSALLLNLGLPFLPALLSAGIIAGFIGALIGVPSFKLEGPYLAIATLAFGMAVTIIIGRLDVFGGRMGMSVPRIQLGWTGLKYDISLYYIFIGITVIMVIITRNIVKSRIGRAFQAIRDSDIAASVAGVHLAKYKTMSFAISAFYAGLAGCLWALYLQFVTPGSFSFMMSVLFLATVVLGGLGSVTGSVMGAILMSWLSLQLEKIVEVPVLGHMIMKFTGLFMNPSGIANITWVITGLILIMVILFEPLGLFGLWLRIKRYWKMWPF
ncbi:MAG TPA: branched-chain amino acid ABC transporter permease [Saprospiraceae bacterium]|nr:branched-chain amino acid ABC transporter permease [Saprospiraceae bacterium]